MDIRSLFGSNELFCAAFALSIGHILINWSIQRAREKEWQRQKESFAMRERYFEELFKATRLLMLESERRRLERDIRHAKWREMAGPENQDAAQSLIDVDTISEYSAALDGLVKLERKLSDRLGTYNGAVLYDEVMGDPFIPPEWNRQTDNDSFVD